MEEVRSYWQVTSISHFCNIFGKPFKLPTFEPEELEQAFILDIPEIVKDAPHNHNNNINNSNSLTINGKDTTNTNSIEVNSDADEHQSNIHDPHNHVDQQTNGDIDINGDEAGDADDEEYKPTRGELARLDNQLALTQNNQQQPEEQPELHLLVKLAISLLKPHFNTRITPANWENYLQRIVDTNWVELEHHPSPFRVPLISQDGVELTKKLTFNELPLSDKIDLFYALCDYRLWCEDAAEALKDYALEELRLESIGKDSQGYEYWYFSGTRLFRENKELSQDIILRKTRIKELEYKLIELEKNRIFREQEEKRKAELERAKQLANEAREARIAAKKQSERETTKRKKPATPILPPRTGLRERRSSATSNTNDSQQARTSTTRGKQAKQQQQPQPPQQSVSQKRTRNSSKGSKHIDSRDETASPDVLKKSPEEECKEELKRLTINPEDRAEAWCLQCDSLEEWESFATKYEKTKSVNEKYLSAYVNEELLPKIRAIYSKRAAEVRKKEKELMFSLTSRRVSTRIISKRAQEEEEERKAQLYEAEVKRKKVEAELRLRAELEREMRARRNRFVIEGGTSSTCSEDGELDHVGRYKTRHQQNNQLESSEFDGIIHPDKLSEFYEALELVIDTVRTSKHAWPFVDPVPKTVSGYYDLITEPMDLRKLRTKIEFREYKCLIEVEKDFQLIVNNCERFNGPRNIYTKMVYKLWKSFRKNVRLYFQRDLSMDEHETFVHPPPPKPTKEEPLDEAHPEPVKEENDEAIEMEAVDDTSDLKAPTPEPIEELTKSRTSTPEESGEVVEFKAPTPEPIEEAFEPNAPTLEPLYTPLPSISEKNEVASETVDHPKLAEEFQMHTDGLPEHKEPSQEPIFADSPLYEVII